MTKKNKLYRKITAAVLILLMLFSCGITQAYADGTDSGTAGGYEDSIKANESTLSTIKILHTNDIHGYYTATSRGNIGFAKLKAFADSIGADLMLDAGDTYHGQAFATVEQGNSIAELMKEAGYDAMTPGNHDWSYGADRLKELEKVQGFPILAANVTDKDGNAYFNNPYIVKTVTADDGTQIKVGVLGVIDSSFYSSTPTDNVKNVVFNNQAEAASKTAKILREQEKCDVVIALTHSSDCESFAGSISGIDAVIAGDQHILMDTSYKDMDGKTVYVVEAGYYFQNIGVLSLTYDSAAGSVVSAAESSYSSGDLDSIEADSTVSARIAEIEAREAEILSQVVGESSNDYEYSWEEVRVQEQPIGRIITAAYLERTGADVAFENAGGIRGGITKGAISYKDIIGISPYGNTIVTKELTGRQILSLVEYSLELARQGNEAYILQKEAAAKGEDPYVHEWPATGGLVLQFGGITVSYDMTKEQGSRIISAQIKGEDVNPDKTYVVATNNYVADNTDYPGIAEAALLKEYGTCEQALISYIKKGTFEQTANIANLSAYVPDTKNPDEETADSDNGAESGEIVINEENEEAGRIETNAAGTPATGDSNALYMYLMLEIMAASLAALLMKNRKDAIKAGIEK